MMKKRTFNILDILIQLFKLMLILKLFKVILHYGILPYEISIIVGDFDIVDLDLFNYDTTYGREVVIPAQEDIHFFFEHTTASRVYNLIKNIVVVASYFMGLTFIGRLLKKGYNNTFFNKSTYKQLVNIAKVLILSFVFNSVVFVEKNNFNHTMTERQFHSEINFYEICLILIFVIFAYIFKQAIQIKEENDLTI